MLQKPLPAITEFKSLCWTQVTARAEARITQLQAENEALGLTEAQTAAIRGRIAELRELLKVAAPKRDVPSRDIYHNHD
jgi:hypothetical protein